MLILSQSALAKLGERITPAQWDALKTYSLQDQQYDAIRQEILSQLSTRVDQLPNVSSSDGDYTEQCETLAGIQELLYDLQLVEHVSRGPLIGMAKLVMGMDKRRCVKRVQTVKAKKLGSGSRPQQQQASPSSKHQQRRRLGPAASLSLTFNSSANSPTKLHGDAANRSRHSHLTASTTRNSEERHSAPKMRSPVSSANVSSATETRRGSKQRRSTRAAVWDKEKPSYNRSPLTLTSAAQKALAKGVVGVEDSEGDDEDAVAPAPSSNKSSSTICAKGSAARLIRKKRGQPAPTPRQSGTSRQGAGSGNSGSSSPRKLTTAGSGGRKRASVIKRQAEGSSSSGDDDGDEDETGEDEPTYCLCKRISFGEMICCDHGKCPVEWFHFSCVNIKIKPKGKKWFCPMCRGDKPNVLKTNLK